MQALENVFKIVKSNGSYKLIALFVALSIWLIIGARSHHQQLEAVSYKKSPVNEKDIKTESILFSEPGNGNLVK